MRIVRGAVAGTLESSDVLVRVEPCDHCLEIVIESPVRRQFYEDIKKVVDLTLADFSVTKGRICLNDRGALDCVIAARLETAILRGGERQ
ncbi:citrate lyase acyl carrier protein [Enterocloster lavalensis]|uniref:Citrate lyase subunit gamma (Acyl carrier protein) n=1 Tax=Enterocloster lavalensis TaxID=460384 RepID=A0A1I0JHG1_9FIRM|nr:citrate lyase acyl carrier protein [Enterocloster lavalensis]PST33582.1 citrate lyase acyl carrier protein [Enterocloster lavalensis]SEU09735.1 citrate lyase subunit gamma (acyl carrier protein) [Enterocloster lavalensis]